MIDVELVQQKIPLTWKRDLDMEDVEGSPYECFICAESGDFQFAIMEYDHHSTEFKFAILAGSETESGRGFQQDFATLEEAIAGLELWIRRTILELNAALRPSEGSD